MRGEMTSEEAILYIENYTWSTTRLGLERTRELLAGLGDPQKKLKFVHVTGSNGKGSTCAVLASVMNSAGYKTGLYTSPYLVEFNERIQVDGVSISGEDLADITEHVREIADNMEDHPSQFELVTAIAMEYFYKQGCDIVILEVGMGGALDSTNAIDAPEVAVFTNIGLEHTEYLGSTIEEIAATKGGIIKPGCNCVVYDGPLEATGTLARICSKLDVPMKVADFSEMTLISHSLEGQIIRYRDFEFKYPLLGKHQINNLCVALYTIESLKKRGWNISDESLKRGVEEVSWPARFEILAKEPVTFILDGGHNPQCAEAMAQIMKDYLSNTKCTFLMGVLADKDYDSMLNSVLPFAKRFVCVTPDSPRALEAGKLRDIICSKGIEACCCNSVEEGIEKALQYNDTVIAFGSLYMAGKVIKYFKNRGTSL